MLTGGIRYWPGTDHEQPWNGGEGFARLAAHLGREESCDAVRAPRHHRALHGRELRAERCRGRRACAEAWARYDTLLFLVPRHHADNEVILREQSRDNPLRRRAPVPEPAVLSQMAQVKEPRERNPGASPKIYCIRVVFCRVAHRCPCCHGLRLEPYQMQ